ncbi:MAG: DNA-protecting protein DprA [Candidatus Eremiobacteraeota bacterium]|nr:DNA-protecting protein DprA [Candidatus Eremiobacteraeota bacterium]
MHASERRWTERAELDALGGERLCDFSLDGLWVAGGLDGLAAPCVAVVGTRVPSDEGRRRARRLARDLGRAGVCIISGLALGIDGAAHEGALDAGAPTVGVLGGGHAHFFPPRHRDLAARIVARGGAVVSPFAPDVPAQPWQFLARNAVIAALADAVVVVEAAARSGALNTAGHAADRNIPVLAFPGDVDRPKAAGCNALIRDGATLARDAADVLAALPNAPLRAAAAPSDETDGAESADPPAVRRIIAMLRDGACDAATLADRLALPPPALCALLIELELDGRIVHGPGGFGIAPR